MTRRVLRIGLALLAALAAGHGALWWLATAQLEREGAGWAAARRAEGASFVHGEPRRGGYPLAATLTLPAARFAGALAAPGGGAVPARLDAGAVTLSVALRAPRLLTADIACPCTIGLGGNAPVPLDAAALRLEAPLWGQMENGGRAPVVTGRDLVLGLPQGPLAIASLRAAVPERGAADPGRPALRATLSGIVLPPPEAQWVLGQRIAALTLEARLRGVLPASGGAARALAAWRDSDGALALDSLSLAWGPLSLQAAATVTLDAALQPAGAATARLAGFGPTLDRLVAAGLIGRGQAAIARIALTAASRPAEGGDRVVEIPLLLEDRLLTAARMPLLRLPPVIWPNEAR